MTSTPGLSRHTTVASTSPTSLPASGPDAPPPRARSGSARPAPARRRRRARGGQPLGQRQAAGHRGQAAVEAALAAGLGMIVQPDVADVAGAAVDAAVDLPVDHHAGADAGRHLDQHQRRAVGVVHRLLAQRHEVGVVVHEDRPVPGRPQPVGDRVPVPARHDRRLGDHAGVELDRAGHADADAADPAAAQPPWPAPGGTRRRPSRAPSSGPSPILMCSCSSASSWPPDVPESTAAARAWLPPRSATSTTPCPVSNSSSSAGRPPVDSSTPEARR